MVSSVPSWNVDLLKKNLLSNSQLELQDNKRYLVELYELARRFAEFTDPAGLLKYAGTEIGKSINADRMFPALKNPRKKDGW